MSLLYLADDLAGSQPKLIIDKSATLEFLQEFVEIEISHLAEPPGGESVDLTPFPMLPYLTLRTSSGHVADFETEPECSIRYQKFVTEYFNQLNQSSAPKTGKSAVRESEQEALSMAWLIFVDAFRIMLRSVVDSAIDVLRVLDRDAAGLTLAEVADACGLGHPAGLRRIAHANMQSTSLYAGGSPVHIVSRGVPLEEVASLDQLADRFNLPRLPTARHLREQPVLRPGSKVRVAGGTYRIETLDDEDTILKKFGIADWSDIEAANPFFDWSVPPPPIQPDEPPEQPERTWPYPTLTLPAGETIQLPVIEHVIAEGDTLQSIVDRYGTSLFEVVSQDSEHPIALTREGMAWRCVTFLAQAGESLASLAKRAGLTGESEGDTGIEALFPAIKDNPDILTLGSSLAVPAGRYIIKRGDTLSSLASTFQTTPDDIVKANGGPEENAWKFIPRPGSSEELPVGVEIALPAVAAYRVGAGDTLASIARLYWLESPLLIGLQNADCALQPRQRGHTAAAARNRSSRRQERGGPGAAVRHRPDRIRSGQSGRSWRAGCGR